MRFRTIAAPAAALTAAVALTFCAPPGSTPPDDHGLPGCKDAVTRIYETNAIPCLPTAPQRLDVVPAMSNVLDPIEQTAAATRCNGWGGAIIWQVVEGVNRFVCRTVDPYLYAVWPPLASSTSVASH